jgi:hypothetical protein
MTNVSLKRAERLAKYLTQKELLLYSDVYETLIYSHFTFRGKIKKDYLREMMTYEMALSMQDGVDPSYPL